MFNENFSHEKKFTYNSDGLPFCSLKELVTENGMDKIYAVHEVFVYDAKLGERAAMVTDGLIVNLPNHMISDVKKILAKQEYIDAINAGKCGFKPSTYEDKKFNSGICYSGTFVDV